MGALFVAAIVASTALEMKGQYDEGVASKNAADTEALQMDRQASSERAASQRAAFEERRQADIAQSNLQARAAAGGGGLDVSVVKFATDIEAEGEYRALSRMYEGETAATGLEFQAEVRREEGRQSKRASQIGMLSTALSSAADIAAYKSLPQKTKPKKPKPEKEFRASRFGGNKIVYWT